MWHVLTCSVNVGFCDRLWFLASHLIKPVWWRLERSLLSTKYTYRKGCLGVSTEGCQPLLIVIREPEFLSENGAEPWGHSHPNNALYSSLQDHLYLSFCHHWAFPLLLLLISYIFLSHSSACLSSFSIPVLSHPLSPKPDWPSLCWWGTSRKNQGECWFSLAWKTSQLSAFMSIFLPFLMPSLPASTALVEGLWTWNYL